MRNKKGDLGINVISALGFIFMGILLFDWLSDGSIGSTNGFFTNSSVISEDATELQEQLESCQSELKAQKSDQVILNYSDKLASMAFLIIFIIFIAIICFAYTKFKKGKGGKDVAVV